MMARPWFSFGSLAFPSPPTASFGMRRRVRFAEPGSRLISIKARTLLVLAQSETDRKHQHRREFIQRYCLCYFGSHGDTVQRIGDFSPDTESIRETLHHPRHTGTTTGHENPTDAFATRLRKNECSGAFHTYRQLIDPIFHKRTQIDAGVLALQCRFRGICRQPAFAL